MKLSIMSIPVQNPVKAHEIYTTKLGFVSKEFDEEGMLAIVVSAEDPKGTSILLEPCKGNFAEDYQKSAYQANLPYAIFSVKNVDEEMQRLQSVGIKIRPDLDRPKWGLTHLFEDGCGNFLMLEQSDE
ncbi:MAG: VOC family protein [Marinicellaceae bacterium]